MAPTAPRPSTHGSSPNTTALDFPSCSFSQFLIPDLPDDATARCLHAKDVHFRRLSYPRSAPRIIVLTSCARRWRGGEEHPDAVTIAARPSAEREGGNEMRGPPRAGGRE